MKISLKWLKEYIEFIEHDPIVIANELTCAVGEVDEVEEQGKYLKHCVVGKITSLTKHPKADRLSLCEVETDQGMKKVVCGGTNLREGMLVAFAHVGATVKWHGDDVVTLEKTTIRSEESEGMICAAEELDLVTQFPAKPEDGERAIIDLTHTEFTVGTPLKEALKQDDTIITIDNHAITNRPDLFSHMGIARELVALKLATWKKDINNANNAIPKSVETININNDVPEYVTDYIGITLAVDGTKETPEWMKERLTAVGWRPINIIVDITNFVLSEVGMPMHAFDALSIKGTMCIRSAKKGETMETLDSTTHTLEEGSIVMSDDDGIFDLFGVMGGKRSMSTEQTTEIFLHAGIIDPVSVRKTMLSLHHRTDAGTVYEKGLSYEVAEKGMLRALELFQNLCNAHILSGPIEWGKRRTMNQVSVTHKRIESFIGVQISEEEIGETLKNLEYTVEKKEDVYTVTPPVFRMDVSMDQDVIEDVARIHRYRHIPPLYPLAPIVPPERETIIHLLRDTLKENKAFEFLHLAFISPEAVKKVGLHPDDCLAIENPLGEELSLMRPSLLPSLLATHTRELERIEHNTLLSFEEGVVFDKKGDKGRVLMALMSIKKKSGLKHDPWLMLKAILGHMEEDTGLELSIDDSASDLPPYAHPKRSRAILSDGNPVGLLSTLHPSIASEWKLTADTAFLVLSLSHLTSLKRRVVVPKAIPVFPSIILDETFSRTMPYALMKERAQNVNSLLQDVQIIDLFQDGEKDTITLRFTYTSNERTLTQAEVESVHADIVRSINQTM